MKTQDEPTVSHLGSAINVQDPSTGRTRPPYRKHSTTLQFTLLYTGPAEGGGLASSIYIFQESQICVFANSSRSVSAINAKRRSITGRRMGVVMGGRWRVNRFACKERCTFSLLYGKRRHVFWGIYEWCIRDSRYLNFHKGAKCLKGESTHAKEVQIHYLWYHSEVNQLPS